MLPAAIVDARFASCNNVCFPKFRGDFPGRRGSLFVLALVGSALHSTAITAQPELTRAFLFGGRDLDCAVHNAPATDYTVVLHDGDDRRDADALEYDADRGWGFVAIDPDNDGNRGFARFGPFDRTRNRRDEFDDDCPEEIYDSFIGFKDFPQECSQEVTGDLVSPCLAGDELPDGELYVPSGGIFRVDVPDGRYRFVGAFGSVSEPHAHRVLAEDGGSGPPADIGDDHVVLVRNFDQSQFPIGEAKDNTPGAGVYARVGFDDRIPPPADGESPAPQFVDMDSAGNTTDGPADSPVLVVTTGYIRIHLLQGNSNPGPGGKNPDDDEPGDNDDNGGDIVILELWKLDDDADADGVIDEEDNCRETPNPDQADGDGDTLGDVCDACPQDAANDSDGDGRCADQDNCPDTPNPDQIDSDSDGLGDGCDACPQDAANDSDGDGRCAEEDNCPDTPNPDQPDEDTDGLGDACDDCTPSFPERDTEVPTITCGVASTVTVEAGTCEAIMPDLTASATTADNCTAAGLLVISQVPTAGSMVGLGEILIELSVLDAAGNLSSCSTPLTVVDAAAPVVTCAGDLVIEANTAAGYAGSFPPPSVVENCFGTAGVVTTNDAPGAFPLGDTIVTWTSTDVSGNSASCTSVVTVLDGRAPQILCPPPDMVETNASCGYVGPFRTPTVEDNVSPAEDIVLTHDAPGLFPVGSTEVRWTATDPAGNSSTCTSTVVVSDTTPPQIICPPFLLLECAEGQGAATITSLPVTVSDNCDPSPGVTSVPDSGVAFPPGSTQVIYTATDAAGNTTTCEVEVIVNCEPGQVPGDCNQDGVTELSDALCILGFLFQGTPESLPCGDGTGSDPGNRQLLGWSSAEADITLTEAVSLLRWQFLGGPPHVLGTGCQAISGCPETTCAR